MKTSLRIASVITLLVSVIFFGAIAAASAGIRNDLVMAWMVVGPVLYWVLVVLVALSFVLPIPAQKGYSETELMLYLSVSLSLAAFIILGWVGDKGIDAVIISIAASLLMVFVLTRVLRSSIRLGVMLVLVIVAWFVDDSPMQLFVSLVFGLMAFFGWVGIVRTHKYE